MLTAMPMNVPIGIPKSKQQIKVARPGIKSLPICFKSKRKTNKINGYFEFTEKYFQMRLFWTFGYESVIFKFEFFLNFRLWIGYFQILTFPIMNRFFFSNFRLFLRLENIKTHVYFSKEASQRHIRPWKLLLPLSPEIFFRIFSINLLNSKNHLQLLMLRQEYTENTAWNKVTR